jgi:hypothetical protein
MTVSEARFCEPPRAAITALTEANLFNPQASGNRLGLTAPHERGRPAAPGHPSRPHVPQAREGQQSEDHDGERPG